MNEKRTPPVCRIAKKCGACQLSNMDYGRQLRYKKATIVNDGRVC